MRRILHIDMDAFFASVEEALNPSLKGKALIIGGKKSDVRGVVATANYEARKYGVHSAMPLAKARELCPHGIFMRGNFEHYKAASEKVRVVLEEVSPLVEFASIDEAYVDISGSLGLFGGDDAIAAYIKSQILERSGLACTVAISSNKLVSKVAANQAKPDGYLNVGPGCEREFLHPLPISKLPGVGPRTAEVFESLGVLTIGALAGLKLGTLMGVFGQMGYTLRRSARGIATSVVEPYSLPKSISRETTFERDLLDWREIERVLAYLSERAVYAMREKDMETKSVTLKVRYADFKSYTFAKTLPEFTNVENVVFEVLRELLPKAKERRARVRLIGVCLSSLACDQRQMLLFGDKRRIKWQSAMESVDHIRGQYGFGCVRFAKSMAIGGKVKLATPSLSR